MNDEGIDSRELSLLGPDSVCSYLPDQTSRFEHRWIWTLRSEQYESMLERGWRRFGRALFRPACRACRECLSLRIVLPTVSLSKSQRRCLKRNGDVHVKIQPPTVTDEHLRLYNAWHQDMHLRRGWPLQSTTRDDYYETFVAGEFEFSREFLYFRDDRLIGIGLVDITPRVQSSIYFMHDPAWRDKAPGTFSVLSEIAAGKEDGRDYLYMGYYIRDCGSMNYKNRFRPHELLQDYVTDEQQPVWQLPEDRPSA